MDGRMSSLLFCFSAFLHFLTGLFMAGPAFSMAQPFVVWPYPLIHLRLYQPYSACYVGVMSLTASARENKFLIVRC
jgi:hypothetical protein